MRDWSICCSDPRVAVGMIFFITGVDSRPSNCRRIKPMRHGSEVTVDGKRAGSFMGGAS
jgi:hypothetical protein